MDTQPSTASSLVLRAPFAAFERGYFAVFMLAVLFLWNGLMIGIVLLPTTESGLGAFAQDFRKWCFNYSEETGSIDWAYIMPYITIPFALGWTTVAVYYKQIKAVLRRPIATAACVSVAAAVVAVAGISFYMMNANQGDAPTLEFPAKRLRIANNPPPIDLTNQEGDRVTLEQFRGKIVVLTGIYSVCPNT